MANVCHTFWRRGRTLFVQGTDLGVFLKINVFGTGKKSRALVSINAEEMMQVANAIDDKLPVPSQQAPNEACTLIHDKDGNKAACFFGMSNQKAGCFSIIIKRDNESASFLLSPPETRLLGVLLNTQAVEVMRQEAAKEDARYQSYLAGKGKQAQSQPSADDDPGDPEEATVPGEDGGSSNPGSDEDDIPF